MRFGFTLNKIAVCIEQGQRFLALHKCFVGRLGVHHWRCYPYSEEASDAGYGATTRHFLIESQSAANLVAGKCELAKDLRIQEICLCDIGHANARLQRDCFAEDVSNPP